MEHETLAGQARRQMAPPSGECGSTARLLGAWPGPSSVAVQIQVRDPDSEYRVMEDRERRLSQAEQLSAREAALASRESNVAQREYEQTQDQKVHRLEMARREEGVEAQRQALLEREDTLRMETLRRENEWQACLIAKENDMQRQRQVLVDREDALRIESTKLMEENLSLSRQRAMLEADMQEQQCSFDDWVEQKKQELERVLAAAKEFDAKNDAKALKLRQREASWHKWFEQWRHDEKMAPQLRESFRLMNTQLFPGDAGPLQPSNRQRDELQAGRRLSDTRSTTADEASENVPP